MNKSLNSEAKKLIVQMKALRDGLNQFFDNLLEKEFLTFDQGVEIRKSNVCEVKNAI